VLDLEVLWQLLDHQATLDVFAAGLPVRLPRGDLEGYRFIEMATRRSITLRVVHLRAFEGAGKSWVHFMRAIRAGDIMEPIHHSIRALRLCRSRRQQELERVKGK
jgi:hypothetical protein